MWEMQHVPARHRATAPTTRRFVNRTRARCTKRVCLADARVSLRHRDTHIRSRRASQFFSNRALLFRREVSVATIAARDFSVFAAAAADSASVRCRTSTTSSQSKNATASLFRENRIVARRTRARNDAVAKHESRHAKKHRRVRRRFKTARSRFTEMNKTKCQSFVM
jgi:hypothetical protein